jgi:sugar phosphate isomerase/epimerase
MKVTQVAAQLYTVREHLKTPEDIRESLRRIKEIGYPAVQLASLGSLSEEETAKMLEEAGLVCCSSHEDSARILSEPAAIVARLKKLGCRSAAYPYPSGVKLDTLDDVRAFARKLDAAGKVFHEAGMSLVYHNHSIEFRRFDGRLMLEVLYEETDPKHVQAEIDTYWVQYGGGDSEDWCRALKGRLPQLHMKDYAITAESRPTFAEIGQGNLNFRKIVAAAEESGCQWYIVEQDRCSGDPFDSLRISFEYIRDNLCS